MYLIFALSLASAGIGGDDRPGVDTKMAIAFGKDCAELRRPLRLWFPERKMVIAAGDFLIDKEGNGNVKFTTCSIAVFDAKDAKRVVTRIHSDSIVLTLDRPAMQLRDLADRKIVRVTVLGFPKLEVAK